MQIFCMPSCRPIAGGAFPSRDRATFLGARFRSRPLLSPSSACAALTSAPRLSPCRARASRRPDRPRRPPRHLARTTVTEPSAASAASVSRRPPRSPPTSSLTASPQRCRRRRRCARGRWSTRRGRRPYPQRARTRRSYVGRGGSVARSRSVRVSSSHARPVTHARAVSCRVALSSPGVVRTESVPIRSAAVATAQATRARAEAQHGRRPRRRTHVRPRLIVAAPCVSVLPLLRWIRRVERPLQRRV